MLTSPNPERMFVEFLFERLLFELVLARNKPHGCCIDPAAISIEFDYILHYYAYLGLKRVHGRRVDAIHNLSFNTVSGVLMHMTNMRGGGGGEGRRYKIFPASLAETFEFGQETGEDYGDHVQCAHVSNKQIKEFRRDSIAKVPQEYQDEIELLVRILKDNELISEQGYGGALVEALLDLSDEEDDGECHDAPEDVYVYRLEKDRLRPEVRLRKEQSLVTWIRSLTSMETIVLSSSAQGINISDFDIELLLTKPTSRSPQKKGSTSSAGSTTSFDTETTTTSTAVSDSTSDTVSSMTMPGLSDLLKRAGYKNVEFIYRYFDTTCEINASYTSFFDPRSELTCQISLSHPLGEPTRDLIQAYEAMDERVGRVVYAAQQILSEHGRCTRFLSNYAVALMVVAFLQSQNVLPNLQHHQRDADTKSSGNKSQRQQGRSGQGQQLPSFKLPPLGASKTMSKNQKRANARRNRKRLTSGTCLQAKTLSGSFRMIDCYFDRALAAKERSAGLMDDRIHRRARAGDSVGDLLVDFLGYFAHDHQYGCQEVSVAFGDTVYRDGSDSGNTPGDGASSTSGTAPTTTTTPIGPSAGGATKSGGHTKVHQCGLVVRDPFVPDRNITRLCEGWKLAATRDCFERAFDTLLEVELKDLFWDLDDEDEDEDEDDDDDENEDEEDEDEEEGNESDVSSDRSRNLDGAGDNEGSNDPSRVCRVAHIQNQLNRRLQLKKTRPQPQRWHGRGPLASALIPRETTSACPSTLMEGLVESMLFLAIPTDRQ